jgi:hypothetical protein
MAQPPTDDTRIARASLRADVRSVSRVRPNGFYSTRTLIFWESLRVSGRSTGNTPQYDSGRREQHFLSASWRKA